jgi:hypothetical protein
MVAGKNFENEVKFCGALLSHSGMYFLTMASAMKK